MMEGSQSTQNNFISNYNLLTCLVGPMGAGTIVLDPTFGSFTLLEPISD